MIRVLVIHRDLAEGAERASRLRALGFDAAPYLSLGAKGFRGIRQDPPHAILIDLTRLPSYGKAMGVLLRQQKTLRSIPLVFVEGDPDKAAQVRAVLPDAEYTTSAALGRELPELAGMIRQSRRVWVLWPKKASGAGSDLTMVRIREMASEFGLVDYKVCAVDETWSAMTLGKRRTA